MLTDAGILSRENVEKLERRYEHIRDATKEPWPLQNVLDAVETTGGKSERNESKQYEYRVTCPCHDDDTPSMIVTYDPQKETVAINCFVRKADPFNRTQDELFSGALEVWDLTPDDFVMPKVIDERSVAEYPHFDEDGNLLYQVVRFNRKINPYNFRRPNPKRPGKWIWGIKGIEQILYRLPELIESDLASTVYLVEGWKDVDTVVDRLNYVCTTSGGGSSWKSKFNGYFRDRSVVLLPDNDNTGRAYSNRVARELWGIAKSIKIVSLPAGPKGDVTDFLEAGGTKESFDDLVNQTPVLTEPPAEREDKVIEGKPDYIKLAETFIRDYGTRLFYYRKEWWEYQDGKYHKLNSVVLESEVSKVFRDYQCVNRTLTRKGKLTEDTNPLQIDIKFKKELLSAIRDLTVSKVPDETSEPFFIDSGKPLGNPYVIMFRNGLLDVQSNKLIPHNDNLFTTATLSYDYDPQATCPLWIESVDQWFEGDAERRALLQEWYGYNLTMSNHLQQMMFMYGQPGSGKGTAVYVLENLLDGNYQAADTRSLCEDLFGMAALEGKYAALIAEEGKVTHARGQKLMDVLKRITGEDTTSIRGMQKIARNGKLFCRVTYYSNELPTFHDEMQTMLRRTNLLAFRKSFQDKPNRTLRPRLLEELPGIAAWAVAGLKRLLANGKDFTLPTLSKREIEEIKIEGSPLRQMLDKYLIFTANPDDFVSRRQLYDLYRAVCAEDHVDHPVSAAYFPRRCREAMPKLEDKQHRLGNGGERGYRWVRMTEEGIFKCADVTSK